MDYLLYKKKYPKSFKIFLNWVYPKRERTNVDNTYLPNFFAEIFEYICGSRLININNEKYVNFLKTFLNKGNEMPVKYKYNDKVQKFEILHNDKIDFIRLDVSEEEDYENAFFILEKLIENKLYEQ